MAISTPKEAGVDFSLIIAVLVSALGQYRSLFKQPHRDIKGPLPKP